MNKKILVLSILAILAADNIYAGSEAITNANNQAYIDGQLGYERFLYSRNHPANAGAPLYNANGGILGAQFGLTKTFGCIYSQIALDASRSLVNYSDSSLTGTPLSQGKSVSLSLDARLGYSFFMHNRFAFTPYFLGGYTQNQLDTGGYSSSFISGNYSGTTFVTQYLHYGIGALNQWAANPQWVLSLDALLGTQANPRVSANVDNFNNQASATTTYQKWPLKYALFWKVGAGSDYRFTNNVHLRADLAYGKNKLGGATTSDRGAFPSQNHPYWLGTLGLGYNFANFSMPSYSQTGGGQQTIYNANNQGSFHFGYETQNFSGGTTANEYHLKGGLPTFGIAYSKTWNTIYTQIAATEAYGATSSQVSYGNATTHNNTFDVSGKLGYVYARTQNIALTPYATLGYHRALQNIQGMPTNESSITNNVRETYYINGVAETYQHSWYGIGLRAQWSPLSKLVLSADGNVGRTFNANMHSWAPLNLPIYTSYSLGGATYQMAAVGADYLVENNWHLSANASYLHYTYSPSGANVFGISTVTDRVHQYSVDLGIGYSFA